MTIKQYFLQARNLTHQYYLKKIKFSELEITCEISLRDFL